MRCGEVRVLLTWLLRRCGLRYVHGRGWTALLSKLRLFWLGCPHLLVGFPHCKVPLTSSYSIALHMLWGEPSPWADPRYRNTFAGVVFKAGIEKSLTPVGLFLAVSVPGSHW